MQTILIQDDPALLQTLDGGLLQRESLRLLLAGSGDDLIECSRRECPDMVIFERSIAGGVPAEAVTELSAASVCFVLDDEGVQVPEDPGAAVARRDCRHRIQASICHRLGLADRTLRRHRVRMPARITTKGETRAGTTRDLSASGVFVVTAEPFDAGTEVTVSLRGRRFAGTVVRGLAPEAGRLSGLAVCFAGDAATAAADVEALLGEAGDRA